MYRMFPQRGSLVRTVETRALNRALGRLLDVSKADLNNEFVGEEEYGTLTHERHRKQSRRKSPQEIKAERDKKYMEDELDADQATERGDISDSSGETHKRAEDPIDW